MRNGQRKLRLSKPLYHQSCDILSISYEGLVGYVIQSRGRDREQITCFKRQHRSVRSSNATRSERLEGDTILYLQVTLYEGIMTCTYVYNTATFIKPHKRVSLSKNFTPSWCQVIWYKTKENNSW